VLINKKFLAGAGDMYVLILSDKIKPYTDDTTTIKKGVKR